jgi:hypothetical protein
VVVVAGLPDVGDAAFGVVGVAVVAVVGLVLADGDIGQALSQRKPVRFGGARCRLE